MTCAKIVRMGEDEDGVEMKDRVLIIGYGNPDREDDGVAWHVLGRLAARLGRAVADLDDLEEDGDPAEELPRLLGALQLVPELAEAFSLYDAICFVDAHAGSFAEDIHFQEVSAQYEGSPFTHHLTPATCLALVEAVSGRRPRGVLVAVRGHRFGFARELSPETKALAVSATELILAWLAQAGKGH